MNLVTYHREGGPFPPDDELLSVDADGRFTLRRVVATGRAGQFAGKLRAADLKALKRLIEELGDEPPPEDDRTRRHVVERIGMGERQLVFARESEPGPRLLPLVEHLRKLAQDLTGDPVASLAMALAPDATSLTLQSVGTEAAKADFSAASLGYSLFGEDQGYLTSGALPLPFSGGEEALAPGWSIEVPLPPELEFTPERTLSVQFTCSLEYGDGLWRDVQLTAIAGKGWF